MTNTYIDGILLLLFALVGVGVVFGVLYPTVMVILFKFAGSKLSVKEILKRI